MRYFINGNEFSSSFFFEMLRLELQNFENQKEISDLLFRYEEYMINGMTFQIKGE